MIEETVLNYLNKKLTVPVFLENRDIEEYFVIGKTGSGRVNFANSATFFLQSYASTRYKAALLNEQVKKAMDDLAELKEISYSRLNTDYDFTDTAKKKYRYQAVYDIGFY